MANKDWDRYFWLLLRSGRDLMGPLDSVDGYFSSLAVLDCCSSCNEHFGFWVLVDSISEWSWCVCFPFLSPSWIRWNSTVEATTRIVICWNSQLKARLTVGSAIRGKATKPRSDYAAHRTPSPLSWYSHYNYTISLLSTLRLLSYYLQKRQHSWLKTYWLASQTLPI